MAIIEKFSAGKISEFGEVLDKLYQSPQTSDQIIEVCKNFTAKNEIHAVEEFNDLSYMIGVIKHGDYDPTYLLCMLGMISHYNFLILRGVSGSEPHLDLIWHFLNMLGYQRIPFPSIYGVMLARVPNVNPYRA